MGTINISDLDKAEVLASLFNASHPQGMGLLQPHGQAMSIEEARELLAKHNYFDYVRGRVMKIDLEGDELLTVLYNRDNGEDAAEKVIERLRSR